MKLGTKIAIGFGIAVLITFVLGLTSYVMFNRVDANVAALKDHNLATVTYASEAERSSWKTLEQEKNYIIYEKDEFDAGVKKMFAEVEQALEKMETLATQFQDTALAGKVEEARTQAAKFDQSFAQTVTILKDNKAKTQTMDAAGEATSQENAATLAAKKDEYKQASQALNTINQLNSAQLEMRLNMVSYFLRHEQTNLDAVQRLSAAVIECCDTLNKLNPSEAEKQQLADGRKAADAYIAKAREWAAEFQRDAQSKRLAELNTALVETGRSLTKLADAYQAAKATQVASITDTVFLTADLDQTANKMRVHEKLYMIARNDRDWTRFQELGGEAESKLAALNKLAVSDADRQRVARLEKSMRQYQDLTKTWIESDKNLRAKVLPELKAAIEQAIAVVVEAQDQAWTASDERSAEVAGIVTSSKSLIIISLIVGMAVGVLAAFVITRGITKPINRIIAGLNDGAEQVNDAAGQVSTASQQLAEAASEQASSLEETSSALEEMAAMTRNNAANAKEANERSLKASQAADEGDKTMHQLNDAMAGINDSSEKISKIIKVIEEIAFQTNLLALNAAVEAARAGEHGKGFAVVADEVRNLARRSAQAAKETTELIEDAVTRSREGTQVAGEVGKVLGGIVEDVAKVTELINGISQASEEQAQGVEQVNIAVSQMDKVTQQNASGAEESASASEELAAQAQAVRGMVDELSTLVSGQRTASSIGSTPHIKPSGPKHKKTPGKVTRQGKSTVASAAASSATDLDEDLSDLQDF